MSESTSYDTGSSFEYYSTGIAAEDLVFDGLVHEVTLKVIPFEKTYMYDGDLSEQKKDIEVEIVDSRGVMQKNKVVKNNYITAIWIPMFNTNRSSPPDIYKGQTVLLYKQKNKDIYYWADMFFEPSLKKLEHIDFMVKAKPFQEPENDSYVDRDFYRVWMSTRLKTLGMVTSKADGEKKLMSVNFNTKYSYMRITERLTQKKGNIFQMDFENGAGLWTARNTLYLAAGKAINFVIDPTLMTEDMTDPDEGSTVRHLRRESSVAGSGGSGSGSSAGNGITGGDIPTTNAPKTYTPTVLTVGSSAPGPTYPGTNVPINPLQPPQIRYKKGGFISTTTGAISTDRSLGANTTYSDPNRQARIESDDHRSPDGKSIPENCCEMTDEEKKKWGSGIKYSRETFQIRSWNVVEVKSCQEARVVGPNVLIDSASTRIGATNSVNIKARKYYSAAHMRCMNKTPPATENGQALPTSTACFSSYNNFKDNQGVNPHTTFIVCPAPYTRKGGGEINIEENVDILGEVKINVEAPDINIKAAKKGGTGAGVVMIEGETIVHIKAPKIILEGDVSVLGDLSVSGDLSVGGSIYYRGSLIRGSKS